jgi:hypothetical protein
MFMTNMRKTLQPITNRGSLEGADTSQISEAAETLLRHGTKEDVRQTSDLLMDVKQMDVRVESHSVE